MKFHRNPLSESSSAASASSASAAKAKPTAAARRTKAVAASVSSAVDEFDNQNDNRNHDDDDNQLQQTLHCKQILEEITDCTENGTLRNISACVREPPERFCPSPHTLPYRFPHPFRWEPSGKHCPPYPLPHRYRYRKRSASYPLRYPSEELP